MNEQDKKRIQDLIERKDVNGLVAELTDKSMDVRVSAAVALGDIGDKRAVEPLIRTLNDTTDYPVIWVPLQVPCIPIDARGEAALALGKIGGKAAVEALQAITDTNPEKGHYRGLSVNEAVKKALNELGIDKFEDETAPQNVSEKPDEDSRKMVKTASKLRTQRKLEEALEWAKRATDKDPSSGVAWMVTGQIYVDQRDVLSATRAFCTAVNVAPEFKGSEPGGRLAVVYDILGMREALNDVAASLTKAGVGLEPNVEREWEQLIASVDPEKLRAVIEGREENQSLVKHSPTSSKKWWQFWK